MSPSADRASMARPPLRVLIADDEPLARDCLRVALRGRRDVRIVAECADGAEAVTAIEAERPDVVFLDVQMPGVDAFGVVEAVGVERMPVVVFVTAFDAHALRAFRVHALDYVLKPFDDARLLEALDRAAAQVQSRRDGARARQLAALVAGWAQGDDADTDVADMAVADMAVATRRPRAPFVSRITVRDDDRIRFVACADVDWIEADGNYVALAVGGRKHRVRLGLRALAERLDPSRFVRIHRSMIVNVERIREVQPWYGGDYVAIMQTGAQLRVSRSRAALLLRTTV